MNVNAPKSQSQKWLTDNHRPGGTIGRHSLSQPLRAASSLREGAGKRPHNANHPPAGCFVSGRVIFWGFVWGVFLPFNRVLAKIRGCGRFSSPLRRLRNFYIPPFIGGHSLSLAFARQLPQRGSREGLHRSTGPYYSGWAPWNSTWRGSICQWFWVMVSSFWESFSSRPGLRVMHSRVGPAPLRQKAAPVVRTRASMRE